MFVLQRITSEAKTAFTILGEKFNLIDKYNNPDDFEHAANYLKFPKDEVFGVIAYKEGSELIPLYKKSIYIIKCSDGNKFKTIRQL
jgi:hypothetical protein